MNRRNLLKIIGMLPFLSLVKLHADSPVKVTEGFLWKLFRGKRDLPGTTTTTPFPSLAGPTQAPYVILRVTRDMFGNYSSVENCGTTNRDSLTTFTSAEIQAEKATFLIPEADYHAGIITKNWLDSMWSLRDCVTSKCPHV